MDTGDAPPVLDAHVHFWDPGALEYPWLNEVAPLRRTFWTDDFAAATRGLPIESLIFVEANATPAQAQLEARMIERLIDDEPRIVGLVAFVDVADPATRGAALDAMRALPHACGVRQNIQEQPAGFALQRELANGVREVGDAGLAFDLCATQDQLGDVLELARRCPGTRLVLDHCGKPAIAARLWEPWASHIRALAELDNVYCKISGLFTEADPARRGDEDILPYASHAIECFGANRVMYGGDWPVLTLAAGYAEWYHFTRRLLARASLDESERFYRRNALSFYDLDDPGND